jgi:hypothetical protein
MGLGAVACFCLLVPALLTAQKPTKRVLFVDAVDAGGKAVTDLGPADFAVKVNGAPQPISLAALGNGPMRIIVLVDTSQAADKWQSSLREGLTQFVDAIGPQHEMALMTIGRQFRPRTQPNTDRAKLKNEINHLGLDGLLEADQRFQRKEEVRWPVYLILTTDSTMSNNIQDPEWRALLVDLVARGATIHAVGLQNTGPSITTEVAETLTKVTGGSYNYFSIGNALPEKLKAIAAQINADYQKMTTRYQVEYMSAAPTTATVNVSVVRGGITPVVSFRRPF